MENVEDNTLLPPFFTIPTTFDISASQLILILFILSTISGWSFISLIAFLCISSMADGSFSANIVIVLDISGMIIVIANVRTAIMHRNDSMRHTGLLNLYSLLSLFLNNTFSSPFIGTFTTNAMANPMTNGMSILMSQLNILDTLSKLNSTYANSTTPHNIITVLTVSLLFQFMKSS